ncbi:RHS repeat-associated core domain-containing protein [Pseudomonas sp. H11T01]|uniref:RHS repeat-associated core domain-containing protein n=1 Tax=Pseudomonas sp. H11T01 TaxID=3402749 RepID=UPI003AD09A27
MSNSRDSSLIHYQYDALDRLVSCTPAGQPRLDRLYQKDRLTTEIQGAIQRQIFQCTDMLLAELRQEGIQRTSLLMTDKQRSVLQTSDGTSAYTPYGHRPAEGGLTSLLGFNGERHDPITGHYLLGNGHRAFNPVLMRFNSPDSLSPFGKGGLNGYAYCEGDPINRTDPTGKYWQDLAWITMGVADLTGSYLLSRLPSVRQLQPLAQRIPGVGSTGFGRTAKGIAIVSGFSATALFPVMGIIGYEHPDSPLNDPLMIAMATLSGWVFISGFGLSLHKLARPSKVPKRTRVPRLTRSQSLPNMPHNLGSNFSNSSTGTTSRSSQDYMAPLAIHKSPAQASNANLDKFNWMARFNRGEFRPESGVVQNSTSIRRNSH